MNAEDRLRAVLTDRADRARTSPDALGAVFGRVAQRRRRTRTGVALGVTATLLAGTAFASSLRAGTDAIRPADPTPVVSYPVATPEVTESPVPTESPAPTPTRAPETTPTATPAGFPADSAVAVLADGAVVVLSTTTGEVLAAVGKAALAGDERPTVEWSPDRSRVYVDGGDCRIVETVVATQATRAVGEGRAPEAHEDGRVAAVGCDDGVAVFHPDGKRDFYPHNRKSGPDVARGYDAVADTVNVAWEPAIDVDGLLLSRTYTDQVELLWLDVATASEVQSGHSTGVVAELVEATGDRYVTATFCCRMGGPGRSSTLEVRERTYYSDPVRSLEHPQEITHVALDRKGNALFVDATGLWRVDETRAVLVRRGVLAAG
jgi:hypothetical protein